MTECIQSGIDSCGSCTGINGWILVCDRLLVSGRLRVFSQNNVWRLSVQQKKSGSVDGLGLPHLGDCN